jgi:CheY-like chemotaxis protein
MISLKNRTILVVEDDELNFIYINHILKLAECNVAWVKTGLDAIDYARSFPGTDLILMDIQLPDMSGEKAVETIRSHNFRMPIIAQTASLTGCNKEKLLGTGCDDLITKPFGVNELLDVIARYIP